jgi:hypothetical protein
LLLLDGMKRPSLSQPWGFFVEMVLLTVRTMLPELL